MNGGIKLWFYSIEEEEWNDVDLSFLRQERIRLVTTVDHTPYLLFEYEEIDFGPKEYLLVDVDIQSKEVLHIPIGSEILDQQNGKLLLSQLEKEEDLVSGYSLSIYDVSSSSNSLIPMTIPLVGDSYAVFVPESDYISYRTLAGKDREYRSIVLFDTITSQSISIPITQYHMEWNADFSCLYDYRKISCRKEE